MCKVALAAKINDSNRNDVWVFMQMLGQLISFGNNDGLGYAAFDEKGNIFGERWLFNDSAFKDLSQVPGITAEKMAKIYNFFGDKVVRDEAQAIILHTRAATCGKGIANTHPFIDDEDEPKVAIIHNGMIYNEKKFPRKYSTCDSEVLAHLYTENKVSSDLINVNKFTKDLEGWYTVLSLSKDDNGQMIVDAYSDTGRLGSYFIKELDTRIYSSNASDVLEVAKKLGLTATDEDKMDADTAMRLDALTGEQIAHIKIEGSTSVPVKIYPGWEWEGWGEVITMEGNLDDEEFRKRFLKATDI